VSLLLLALVCLKVGTFVFGGGMTMIPMMEQDVVFRYHWLTEREFVDAIALGQMTPGPLLVSATFVGYKVYGVLGAVVATVCIFLPSFLMTIFVASVLLRVRERDWVKSVLAGVNAGVVGLLAAAVVSIGRSALGDAWTALFALGAFVALVKFRVDAVYVILAGGVLGLLIFR